jgi:hypothetical protein
LEKANEAIDMAKKQSGRLKYELVLLFAAAAVLALLFTAAAGYANVG